MKTPRTQSHAQPEIHFAGAESAVPAAPRASDPAVTAAFLAFHRSTGGFTAPARSGSGFVSGSGLALAVLAIVGFGGGLFLAFFSFNSPEGSAGAVAARPPEMIYTARPAAEPTPESPDAPTYADGGDAGIFSAAAFELRAGDPAGDDPLWNSDAGATAFDSLASFSSATGAPVFAAAAGQTLGSGAASDLASGAITAEFGALTAAAAPVPEPSTWATMITGAGLLFFATRFRRRGR